MTIRFPDNVERSIRAAVQSGRFPSVDEGVTAAWLAFDGESKPTGQRPAMTRDEFHRQLLADGVIFQLPDSTGNLEDDEDEPVVIEGEPLSETIIRERR